MTAAAQRQPRSLCQTGLVASKVCDWCNGVVGDTQLWTMRALAGHLLSTSRKLSREHLLQCVIGHQAMPCKRMHQPNPACGLIMQQCIPAVSAIAM